MSEETYKDVLEKLPEIAEAVNKLDSEGAQVEALRALLGALDIPISGGSGAARALRRQPTPEVQREAEAESEEEPPVEEAGEETEETPNAIVNRLKERDDFGVIEKEILHQRSIWPKIQLVMWAAKRPLTSGEIAQVLQGFELKTDYSTVSHKLSDMSGKVRTTESRKQGANPGYQLTGPARAEFQEDLKDVLS